MSKYPNPDECDCSCHYNDGVRHVIACCYECANCGKQIKHTADHKCGIAYTPEAQKYRNLEFACPECGSSYFGSSIIDMNKDYLAPDNMARHCNGRLKNGHRCQFTWNRSQDDNYFVPREKRR